MFMINSLETVDDFLDYQTKLKNNVNKVCELIDKVVANKSIGSLWALSVEAKCILAEITWFSLKLGQEHKIKNNDIVDRILTNNILLKIELGEFLTKI